MTPQNKAWELVQKYLKYQHYLENDAWNQSKECALIAVDEIIEVTAPYCDRYEPYYLELKAEMTQQYWQEVKQEIINL
ncbi:MAG TPA: hypothetical protein DEB23_03545 [Chitinophagaceae bacterium]|nr:hypothetical protein [Chitinophagaceae bacterium]